jgi:CopG family transcriptional regulator/antitoxin EndoAI
MRNCAKSAFRNQLDNIQDLYVHYLHEAEHMSTVNISFNPDLLRQIDEVAQEESRSRSELLREAARAYIERKRRWAQIFKIGAQTAKSRGITPEDLEQEIRSYRASQQK